MPREFPAFHQKRAVRENIKHKRYLVADEMGTGKTAIGVLTHLKLEDILNKKIKTLVICPNSVKNVWYERIQEYCRDSQVVEIVDSKNRQDSLDRAGDSDFTIINYEMIFRSLGYRDEELEEFYDSLENGNGDGREAKKIIGKLKQLGFEHVVIDEVHNAKNPEALRSQDIENIAKSAEYLTMLSGTPLPNKVEDIGMLMTMLEPEKYPSATHFNRAFRANPELVHLVLSNKMQRRRSDEVMTLPDLLEETVEVELSEEQRAVYDSIYENDYLNAGDKLIQLRKALINPSLVREDALALETRLDVESEKFRVLDEILEDKCRNGKVVVYTSLFKEGVTKNMEERYQQYGALRIDGDVDAKEKRDKDGNIIEDSDREKVRKEFQENPEKRVLFATLPTMREGVDLTAANYIVFLDKPYTHAEEDQGIKRVHRWGQDKPVTVLSLVAKDTVDEGVEELIEDKRVIAEMTIDGKASKDDIKRWKRLEDRKDENLLQDRRSPAQRLSAYSRFMRGKGSEENLSYIKSDGERVARDFAEIYVDDWEGSYSDNTSRMLKSVLRPRGTILDLGSGPAVISRMFNMPAVNIDMNPYQLDFGRRLCEEQGLGGEYIEGFMQDLSKLGIEDGSFDNLFCSLSLHYNDLEERMQTLEEANRVLRQNGRLILTFPYSILNSEGDLMLRNGLKDLGFRVEKDKTGFVRGIKPERSRYKGYVLVGRKYKSAGDSNPDLFVLNTEEGITEGKKYKVIGARRTGSYDGLRCDAFAFFDPSNGETYEARGYEDDIVDLIRQYGVENIPEEKLREYGYRKDVRKRRGKVGDEVRLVKDE